MKVPQGIYNAIEEIFRIRQERNMLQAQEKELVTELKTFMTKHKLDIIETERLSAEKNQRSTLQVDPDKLYDKLDGDWDKFIKIVTIRLDPKEGKEGARSYLGEKELERISSKILTEVINIKTIKTAATKPQVQPKPKSRKATTA